VVLILKASVAEVEVEEDCKLLILHRLVISPCILKVVEATRISEDPMAFLLTEAMITK